MFKATGLIAEAFDRYHIKYQTIENEQYSVVDAGYNINGGPTVRVQFFSSDNNNDIQIRAYGMMHNVPDEKRAAVLEACNRVNQELRFYKFFLDKNNDLIGQTDIPAKVSEEDVGECCFELFVRAMQILDKCYHYFPEAVYSSEPEKKPEPFASTLDALQYLRDHPITIPHDPEKQKDGEK